VERVLVIGSPGSGKSTLAAAVAHRTGLPLIHLDQHYWQPGWIEPDKEAWARRVEALASGDRWVIDGNYGATLGARLARADTVLWLDFSTRLCLWRVTRRALRHRGTVRPDMAEGCPERLGVEFVLHILRFRFHSRPRVVTRLRGFTGSLLRFRTPREAAHWLAGLGVTEVRHCERPRSNP
jgi:adenylate kinase family enzyme